jgi:hypothetical protein
MNSSRSLLSTSQKDMKQAAVASPNAPSLELENEPRLVAEIVLIVVPGGKVVNETRQKIIGFDRPDRQVRSDFNIDATPKHHILGSIAGRAKRASGATV